MLPLLSSTTDVLSSLYFPKRAGLLPPKHAAPKVHESNVLSLVFFSPLIWRLQEAQPNNGITPCDTTLFRPHAPPRGQRTQFQSCGSTDVSFRYSVVNSQSSGFFQFKLIQLPSPTLRLLQPDGHALHRGLGSLSCG